VAVTYDTPAQVAMGAAADASQHFGAASGPSDALIARMPEAVKGKGYSRPGGTQPLNSATDANEIFDASFYAAKALRTATRNGIHDTDTVYKSLSPSFVSQFPGFLAAGMPGFGGQGMAQLVSDLTTALRQIPGVDKNFTLNTPLSTGFVPFDLAAPSRLIYPVYTPLRNKIPRVAGQGTSRRVKVITGISGTQTGNQGVVDIAIPELVSGTSISGTWPLNLPGSGSQTAVDLNVPYQFFGLTEGLSWLGQFAAQGFEDLAALANLVLLQEFMLAEEYAMLAATPAALATPGTPTVAVRTAGSNETAVTGGTSHFSVKVTATNYYGETIASAQSTDTTVTTSQVADVTIAMVAGALSYNIYVSNSSAAPTNAQYWLQVGSTNQNNVITTGSQTAQAAGGLRFTIQGAMATTGANPPLADTGTGKNIRMAGIFPVLDGQASTAGVYPANWQAGYGNQKLGTHLSITAINNALQGMFDGTGSISPGAFRADPDELIGEGGDIMRMSNDIVQSGSATNFRMMVQQDQSAGITSGAAVSEFQNPITRKLIKILVHPFLSQGNALLMGYSLPYTWTNVANTWEMTLVQDYISIAWPVIDMTFRYSLAMYGALVANAPYYCARLGGIQVSDTTPYS
jgi:hypothetical protein